MTVSADAIEQAKELFAPFGEIRVRRMFGGAGVYCDDLFFAILDGAAIYLKVDDETRAAFEARGQEPFRYETRAGDVGVMSYYAAPDDLYDDDAALREWTTLALDAARRAAQRAAKFKKPKKKK